MTKKLQTEICSGDIIVVDRVKIATSEMSQNNKYNKHADKWFKVTNIEKRRAYDYGDEIGTDCSYANVEDETGTIKEKISLGDYAIHVVEVTDKYTTATFRDSYTVVKCCK
jgi:hypothetical protein